MSFRPAFPFRRLFSLALEALLTSWLPGINRRDDESKGFIVLTIVMDAVTSQAVCYPWKLAVL